MAKEQDRNENHLAEAILALAREIHELHLSLNNNAVLCRIAEMENKIMSAISDYGDRVNSAFDRLGTAVDGIASDVDFLKAEILKLQTNPGPISPEDQAILDGIQSRADTLAAKVEALDAATEQVPTP